MLRRDDFLAFYVLSELLVAMIDVFSPPDVSSVAALLCL
jgi:hypothetical protein